MRHRDVKYSLGPTYSKTGIYYTSVEDAFRWIDFSDLKGYLGIVEPLGEIEEHETKFKADGIRILELMNMSKAIDYLLDHGADPRVYYHHALIVMCVWGDLALVKKLIAAGCDPSTRFYGPVVVAAAEGHLEIVKYLESLGSNLFSNENEALRLAAENGHLRVVRYLIEKGAKSGWNQSIIQAGTRGYLSIVQFFFELGVDEWALEDTVWWAIARGHRKIVKYLASKNVSVIKHRKYFESRQDLDALQIIDSINI